jgi:hypothetical protein
MRRCDGCGVEKDLGVKETYPYAGDHIQTERPTNPLLRVDCDVEDGGFRCAWVCHGCFHRMRDGMDMWIDREFWESFGFVTAYADLEAELED